MDASLPDFSVQTFIRPYNLVLLDLVFQPAASSLAPHSAHFENVGKVSPDGYPQGNEQGRQAIVDDFEFLITRPLPQEFRAHHMQCVPRYDDFIVFPHIHIRQIGGENKIVRLDSGT